MQCAAEDDREDLFVFAACEAEDLFSGELAAERAARFDPGSDVERHIVDEGAVEVEEDCVDGGGHAVNVAGELAGSRNRNRDSGCGCGCGCGCD
jgi:hypothetical protein